jgi:hypothetical protein
MPQHHDDIEVSAGDDWVIAGQLTQTDLVTPLDLTGAVDVQWMMLGCDGMPAIPSNAATIEIVAPPTGGKVNVKLPSDVTKTLDPGLYTDALRVVMPAKSTVWTGVISVGANYFDAIDNPPQPGEPP